MKFPPETDEEFNAYLKYQKSELLALPLIPTKINLKGKQITIPEEIREEIAQDDDFIYKIRPRLELFLLEWYREELADAGFEFSWC